MSRRLIAITAAAGLAAAAPAFGQFAEMEPNNSKAEATPVFGLTHGGTITGTTTGSTLVTGDAGYDFFHIRTAEIPLGLYRHRLVLTTSGDQGHTGAIMGVQAHGNPSNSIAVQSSVFDTNPGRMNQWYGFGRPTELYYRVGGTAATTSPYTATYEAVPVTPVNAGTYAPGTFTITTQGVGHTTDTELFLYDASFNLLRYNDDIPGFPGDYTSAITESLAAGTYYIAVSNYNIAVSNRVESTATERSLSGNRMDFPDVIANSSAVTGLSVSFSILDGAGEMQVISALKEAAFDIVWVQFTVVPAPTAGGMLALGAFAAARRRRV